MRVVVDFRPGQGIQLWVDESGCLHAWVRESMPMAEFFMEKNYPALPFSPPAGMIEPGTDVDFQRFDDGQEDH